jgi:hypothetical protein
MWLMNAEIPAVSLYAVILRKIQVMPIQRKNKRYSFCTKNIEKDV